jgi:hypothetical protein
MVKYLEEINRRTPRMPKEELVDESRLKTKANFLNQFSMVREVQQNYVEIRGKSKPMKGDMFGLDSMMSTSKAEVIPNPPKYVPPKFEKGDMFGLNNLAKPAFEIRPIIKVNVRSSITPEPFENLPQGSPISPLLTIFALNRFVNQLEDAVFYADDGIFLSNKPAAIYVRDDREIGAFIHKDKSGYIVENGKIVKECKFLGLTYNLETRELRASTRKGATIGVRTTVFELLEFASKYLGRRWETINRTAEMMKWGFSGYIIAALYSNKYDLSNTVEDLLLHPQS